MAYSQRYEVRFTARDMETVRRALQALGTDGERALQRIDSATSPANRSLQQFELRTQRARTAMRDLAAGFGVGLGVGGLAFGLAAITREIGQMAEAATNVRARLALVLGPQGDMEAAIAGIGRAAAQSRGSVESTVDLYTRLARSTQEMGVSQDRLLGVTTTVNQAIRISGVEASAAQAALVQLGQGLAAGALRGEELNSVMEQTPRLAQAIADGLGVTIGQLREMGKAGELTAGAVVGALESQALTVQREFGRMPVTVADAMQSVRNELFAAVAAMNDASGASGGLANLIMELANSLRGMREATATVTGAVGDLAGGFSSAVSPTRSWIDELIDGNSVLERFDGWLRQLAAYSLPNMILSMRRAGDEQARLLRSEEYRRLAQAGNYQRQQPAPSYTPGRGMLGSPEIGVAPGREGAMRSLARQREREIQDALIEYEAQAYRRPSPSRAPSMPAASPRDDIGGAFQEYESSLARERQAAERHLSSINRSYLQATDQRRTLIQLELRENLDALNALNATEQEKARARVQLQAAAAAEIAGLGDRQVAESQRTATQITDIFAAAAAQMLVDFEFTAEGMVRLFKSMIARFLVEPALANIFGTIGSSLMGSLFGSFGSGVSAGSLSSTAATPGVIYHRGGIVGEAAPVRMIPASLFAAAPRLHQGLMPDEYPAILQRGETVIPRGQRVGGGDIHVHQHMSFQTDVPAAVRREIQIARPSLARDAEAAVRDGRRRNPAYFAA